MAKAAESRVEERRPAAATPFDTVIAGHADALSKQLSRMRSRLFPPSAQKQLRRFPTGEAARLIGITDAYLRQVTLAGEGLEPEKGPAGRRLFTLEQINELRRHLSRSKPGYLPHRRDGEHLQVLAVTNFKGGSGKTTTAVHLAQYLALQGYRVLAVDLDPQASLSALFGYQPEFDVGENETLYGAIRYDDEQRPLADIVRSTYFVGLDLVPGNLDLMELEHDTPRLMAAKRRPSDGMIFARVNDNPQAQIVGLLRSLFGDQVLTHAMLKSTAIADAGLTKQTLYEVGRDQFTRQTYDRALEALDLVNGEVEAQIKLAWGRASA